MRELGIVSSPLIRLAPLETNQVRLYAKAEWHQPTGSVKDRIAASMIASAEREGLLGPGSELLEPSSGNTGIAMARIARLAAYDLTVLVPDNVSVERIQLLEAFGAHIRYSPGSEGSNGAVWRAEEMAAAENKIMLHQYQNQANPDAHESTTGPEILGQLAELGERTPAAVVACLGTGGTLMGTGRALRLANSEVRVVAAEPPIGEEIAGLRSMADGYVPPIFRAEELDGRILIRTGPSIATTRRLLEETGLFCGPSSGAAVAAAIKVSERLEPDSVVVTVLPDAGWKYLSTGIYQGSVHSAEEQVSDFTLW